jgi:chromosome segregation ATPase
MQQKPPPMPNDEAQEYLGKLQTGKARLPEDASPLEHEMFAGLQECSKGVRELTTKKADVEKQIEALKAQVKALDARITELTGEMGGYARLLVSAEGARRRAAAESVDEAKPKPKPTLVEKAKNETPPADATEAVTENNDKRNKKTG